MNYFIVENYDCGLEQLFKSEKRIAKGDYVVVPNYNDEPMVGKVTTMVSRLKALKMNTEPESIITLIDMRAFNAGREKELNDVILVSKMEKQIKYIQNMEKLEKYAGKDPKMLELFNELSGVKQNDEIDSDTEVEF